MQPPDELEALTSLSARIGADPLLIQAAGGNTSIKTANAMWIKASGMQLADANTRNIFVAVDYMRMRRALAVDQDRADQPQLFGLSSSLRPSIETSLHAVFDQRIVVHVHCVNTIAIAIRHDAEDVLAEKLKSFSWAFVPYIKPGAQLALAAQNIIEPETNVIVLGNHGLIVAGDTVGQTEALLTDVISAVNATPGALKTPDFHQLRKRAGDGLIVADEASPLHTIALSEILTSYAAGGSLYPDHVLFCGAGVTCLSETQSPGQAVGQLKKVGLPTPSCILLPGIGALMKENITDAERALCQCLGDVLLRVPNNCNLNYLSNAQDAELLNWDAEIYRKSLS